jgi:hypothetical protein
MCWSAHHEDNSFRYVPQPTGVMAYAGYMKKSGLLNNALTSWKDAFFDKRARAARKLTGSARSNCGIRVTRSIGGLDASLRPRSR